MVEGFFVEFMLSKLECECRVVSVRIAGEECWIPVEDVGFYCDVIGVLLLGGLLEFYFEVVDGAMVVFVCCYVCIYGLFLMG